VVSAHSFGTGRDGLTQFIEDSPTPYHAVAEAVRLLAEHGFREEGAGTGPGGWYTADGGTLMAWFVPPAAGPRSPFRVVGVHTDSPNLRVRPVPDGHSAGWRHVALQPYGDVLVDSWYDRDLGVSGRLVMRDGAVRLICADRPLVRVPRPVGRCAPGTRPVGDRGRADGLEALWAQGGPGEEGLLSRLAHEVDVEYFDILGWDLMLHDVQPAALLGERDEFLVSSRLEALLPFHAGLTALLDTAGRAPGHVPVLVAFDRTQSGGCPCGFQGPSVAQLLRRLVAGRGGDDADLAGSLADSSALTVGMVHASNPASEGSPTRPGPLPNGGPVVVEGSGGGHATDGPGIAEVALACRQAGVPWQWAAAPPSGHGGLTGARLAALLGFPATDVGVAGLSLHSVRELCGADDARLLGLMLSEFLLNPRRPGRQA
jgi:aspartyl aminopeptidase